MNQQGIFQKRIFMTTVGVILCAIAVGFFKCSPFGVDPFQCFAQGIWGRFFQTGLSYGSYYIILSGIMLVLDLFIARSSMGAATLVNMFLTGYVVDFACMVISRFFPNPDLPARIIFLAVGVLVMCFASSLYMTSNLGVSVYDAIPIVIAEKRKLPSNSYGSAATCSVSSSEQLQACCRVSARSSQHFLWGP